MTENEKPYWMKYSKEKNRPKKYIFEKNKYLQTENYNLIPSDDVDFEIEINRDLREGEASTIHSFAIIYFYLSLFFAIKLYFSKFFFPLNDPMMSVQQRLDRATRNNIQHYNLLVPWYIHHYNDYYGCCFW